MREAAPPALCPATWRLVYLHFLLPFRGPEGQGQALGLSPSRPHCLAHQLQSWE